MARTIRRKSNKNTPLKRKNVRSVSEATRSFWLSGRLRKRRNRSSARFRRLVTVESSSVGRRAGWTWIRCTIDRIVGRLRRVWRVWTDRLRAQRGRWISSTHVHRAVHVPRSDHLLLCSSNAIGAV